MAQERMAKVSTPLGDGLVLSRMRGRERLGRPFEYELELLSEDPRVRADRLLGRPIGVSLEQQHGHTRHLHGIAARFERSGTRGRHAVYTVALRPRLWLLSRSVDCRIFSQASIPTVIAEVLRDHGIDDVQSDLHAEYPVLEYQVQYGETALDFITRLMERAGIYYYFRHSESRHTLVLTDAHHEPAPRYEEVPFSPPDPAHEPSEEHLFAWTVSEQIQPGAYALSAYDFEKPRANLLVRTVDPRGDAHAELEHYAYASDYRAVDRGEAQSRLRLEALAAQAELIYAEGNARGLVTGGLFQLTGFPVLDQNRRYLITSEALELENNAFESGDDRPARFRSAITAIDAKRPFRLAAETRVPRIEGPQTAIVVGPSDQEIWTDAYGRVKVQFHWDRRGARDGENSCWVRVAQVWAGARFGTLHLPRTGQEVIVEFLEGDPDQPIITGSVYNADHMPPYALPEHKTQSGIRSRSSGDGTPETFNELCFEDKKGGEEVYLHAERNLRERVENEHLTDVGANRSETVGGDRTLVVKGGRSIHVQGSQSVVIDGAKELGGVTGSKLAVSGPYQVDASRAIRVQSPESIRLECGGSAIVIEPNAITLLAGGKSLLKLDLNANLESSHGTLLKLDVAAFLCSTAGSELLLDVDAKQQSSAGAQLLLDAGVLAEATGGAKVALDTNALLRGAQSTVAGDFTAQLDAGGHVKAEPTGVTVQGPTVAIN